MSILELDNVIIIDYSDIESSKVVNVTDIINHTANTWQNTRSYMEKQKDTELGKLAEDAVVSVFNKLGIDGYYSYDSFRADNFKLHAPFDGIFINNLTNEVVDFINDAVQEEGNRLSIYTRNKIREYNAFTVEVKSTRLALKYKDRVNFSSYDNKDDLQRLINSLMNLDYLTYPHFTRYGDMTFYEYCKFVEKRLNTGLKDDDLYSYIRDLELCHATDIYIRVFMDEVEKKALLMGWIDRESFLTPPRTQKLILPGKSEIPLYFVKSLKQGFKICELKKILKNKRLQV